MVSIDSRGLVIQYTQLLSLSAPKIQEKVRIGFEKPLSSEAEARPAIISLSKVAEEKRNKKPKILYSFNKDVGAFMLIFVSWAVLREPSLHGAILSPKTHASILRVFGSQKNYEMVDWILTNMWKIHIVESATMAAYSLYRGASASALAAWSASTFFAGFTQFLHFNKLNPSSSGSKKAKSH